MSRKVIWIFVSIALLVGATFPIFWTSVARLISNPIERLFGSKDPRARVLEVEVPSDNPVQSAARRLLQPLGSVHLLRRIDDDQR